MPDVTKAQVIALVQAVLATLVAFGVDLDKAQQEALLQLAGVLGGALVVADAIIRNGRSKVVAQRENNLYHAHTQGRVPEVVGLESTTGAPIK